MLGSTIFKMESFQQNIFAENDSLYVISFLPLMPPEDYQLI